MHSYVMVQISPSVYEHFDQQLESCVANALAPYDENLESPARIQACGWCSDDSSDCDVCNNTRSIVTTHNPLGRWDWWQMGGRWSSLFHPDPTYEAANDPRNKGKWPTKWVSDEIHNRSTVSQLLALTDERLTTVMPAAIVTTNSEWINGDTDTALASVSCFRRFLENCEATTLCVVVDCHH